MSPIFILGTHVSTRRRCATCPASCTDRLCRYVVQPQSWASCMSAPLYCVRGYRERGVGYVKLPVTLLLEHEYWRARFGSVLRARLGLCRERGLTLATVWEEVREIMGNDYFLRWSSSLSCSLFVSISFIRFRATILLAKRANCSCGLAASRKVLGHSSSTSEFVSRSISPIATRSRSVSSYMQSYLRC